MDEYIIQWYYNIVPIGASVRSRICELVMERVGGMREVMERRGEYLSMVIVGVWVYRYMV